MKTKLFSALTIIASATVFLVACSKEIGSGNNTTNLDQPHAAKIYLTDHQTPVFDSVFIDIQKLEVKLAGDTISNGGWVNVNIRSGVYNILRLRNGIDTLFGTGTLPNGRIQKLRMTLGTRNSVMKDGVTTILRVKDEDRQVVADVPSGSYEVSNGQVIFWIDFDASQSIQVDNSGSGNNNGYRLKSHLKIFTHSTSGSIEGRVLPRQADAIIKAVMGTDTTMAIPEDDNGEFKIMGLAPGTYKVLIDGQNNYNDTLINNVVVRNREDTHLPVITLHL